MRADQSLNPEGVSRSSEPVLGLTHRWGGLKNGGEHVRYSRPGKQVRQSGSKHVCHLLEALADAEEGTIVAWCQSAESGHLDALPERSPWHWIVLIYQIGTMSITKILTVRCNLVTTIVASGRGVHPVRRFPTFEVAMYLAKVPKKRDAAHD